ncbi:MAG: DNA methylase [Coriobacteriia bacterium]|nr:DNA methylase [Coriobacteriia bacterium]
MKQYIAIDLKSFYASVECVERKLNPLDTYLVVADESRTEKTICLAVTPALKDYGISGRARLFEVIQNVGEINSFRRQQLKDLYNNVDTTGHRGAASPNFTKKCTFDKELKLHPEYELDYIIAPPRMAKYIEVSTQIYNIYLKYIAPEDIHVYSIDEVFIDATPYLTMYGCSAEELASRMINEVLQVAGITATVGVGTNMYLAKIAMDVFAKKMPADENGARIAYLDENLYKKHLWDHRPLTDFWRIGPGITKRLATYGMHTQGDIARCSVQNEDLLYEIFGINAELIIDHAWGWEPCTIADVKSYVPVTNSLGTGQVLHRPYKNDEARLVLREMAELLALDLVKKDLQTNQIVMHIGYDIHNLEKSFTGTYKGEIINDPYGRKIPKYARATINLNKYTSSALVIMDAVAKRFDKITDKKLFVRRINITACKVLNSEDAEHVKQNPGPIYKQMDIYTDFDELKKRYSQDEERETELQKATIAIKEKFGKNAILRGMSYLEGATTKDRNEQIGGHKA